MKQYDVVVIGAGLSGVCAAIKLKEAGISNFHVFEKAEDVGGTWRDNRYPGIACDVPSHLYSYSFAPNPEWSRWYAPGQEIWDYVRTCATDFGVYDQISFNSTIESAVWKTDHWELQSTNGTRFAATSIVSALGGLHTPNQPNIPGQELFEGQQFHTTSWPDDLDLAGKRVAIVGTGATAVQVVPEIADQVEQLVVFQRSPVWVGPKKDPEYTEEERAEFRSSPAALTKLRDDLYQSWESISIDLHRAGTEINTGAEQRARQHIQRSVLDPEVAEALTPEHNFTCKRATVSNRYYETYNKDNVTLVSGAVDSITATGLVSNGQSYDADVIVFATGFKAFNIANEIDLTGVGGVRLGDVWKNRVTSYKTAMIHNFPNLFLMMGPNGTGLHSALQTIEAQGDYVVRMVELMARDGIESLHPKQDAVDAFTNSVEQLFAGTTHSKGCSSWWTDQTGFNHSIWPGSSDEYRVLLAEVELGEFEVVRR
ncbi:MAG: flavin-containing monooxygenase [Halioglobus sp.]